MHHAPISQEHKPEITVSANDQNQMRSVDPGLGTTALAAGVAGFPLTAEAASIVVPCNANALIAAVKAANANPDPDTLVLNAGCTYKMTSAYPGSSNALPVIRTSIELVGPATVTRSSSKSFRIATVSGTGGLTLTTGVAFTNGNVQGDGGAILNNGAVTLTQSILANNTATGHGGGLANIVKDDSVAPAATFTGGSVANNKAGGRGGGIYNGPDDTLTTTGLAITGNRATLRGGGLAAVKAAATTLTGTPVGVNKSDVNAGGVYREGGVMTVTSSPITANIPNNCLPSPPVPGCVG